VRVAGNAISNRGVSSHARTRVVSAVVPVDMKLMIGASGYSRSRHFTTRACNLYEVSCSAARLDPRSVTYHYCSGKTRAVNHIFVGKLIGRLSQRIPGVRPLFDGMAFERADARGGLIAIAFVERSGFLPDRAAIDEMRI
jgi:hypothetical protein